MENQKNFPRFARDSFVVSLLALRRLSPPGVHFQVPTSTMHRQNLFPRLAQDLLFLIFSRLPLRGRGERGFVSPL
jgi:hypothetical protein